MTLYKYKQYERYKQIAYNHPKNQKNYFLLSSMPFFPQFSILFLFMNISLRRLLTISIPKFPKTLNIKPLYYSSNQTFQNMSTLDIVCQKIAELSNITVQQKHLQQVSLMIETTDKNEKQAMIKLLVNTLMKNERVNFMQVIKGDIMTSLLSDKAFVQFQLLLYQISKEKGQKQPNQNKINDLYLEIYQKVLPIAEGLEKIKIQAFFYKNFSRHMVENNHMKKGLETMKLCLEKHQQLITEEYKKVDDYVKLRQKEEREKKKDRATRERQQLRTNSMKQNVRRLIESMFEVLYYYYALKRGDIKQSQQIQLIDILAIFGECLKLGTVIPGIKTYSRYFHRLNQIHFQLEYVFALMKKNKQRIQNVTKMMKQFSKQSFNDLQQAVEYVEIQKQIALALMAIQLHLSRSQRKEKDSIKEDLVNCSQNILEKGKFEDKKTKANIMKLLGQFIKKNC